MTKALTLLKRDSSFYKPYSFKGRYVDSLVFFNQEGIIFQTGHGWLESATISNATNYVRGEDVEYVEVEEPKLKRKVDFSNKFNFYTTHKEEYGNEIKATIYIYVDNETVKVEKKESITKTTINLSVNEFDEVFTRFEITGVNEKVISVVDHKVLNRRLSELGQKAQAMVDKHKNSDYKIKQIDIYTWARILKQYDLIEKPAPTKD